MNTFQLECFLAVAENLSFARAAQQLHITQPAVTQQIKALEKELNAKLFARSTRSVKLTREGAVFLYDSRHILSIARRMTDRDYLWCALNLLLDQQEELARLCPDCRNRALEEPCPACGGRREDWGDNPGFDLGRFERMKRGMADGGLSGAAAGSGPGAG